MKLKGKLAGEKEGYYQNRVTYGESVGKLEVK